MNRQQNNKYLNIWVYFNAFYHQQMKKKDDNMDAE